jgi:hypothetical protein
MIMNAKEMSDRIRVKRKQLQEAGADNLVDTTALPQMNPQDVLNLKYDAQIEETMDSPEKSNAPDDPANADIDGTSQSKAALAEKMARISKMFNRLNAAR